MKIIGFHGTVHRFDQFDARQLGRSCRNPTTCWGFFFSEDANDALEWAQRAERRTGKADGLRIVCAELNLSKLYPLSYDNFYYYLQTARPSTIAKHLQQWKENGYDGLTVVRHGIRWFCAFDVASINIIGVKEVNMNPAGAVQHTEAASSMEMGM